jgi:hypothetical protein
MMMGILQKTEAIGLAFLLFFLILWVAYTVRERTRAEQKHTPGDLRAILAYEKLHRVVKLVVEAGQQMHVSLGDGGLNGVQAAPALTGLNALGRILRRTGVSDRPIIATSGDGAIGILSQDTIQASGDEIDAPADMAAYSAQVSGLTPFSYSVGAAYLLQEQGVDSNFLAGHFGSEVGLMLEASERIGSLTIGGSEDLLAQSILYAGADEPLLGEELFVAEAYLDPDPVHLASLRVQDVLRWLLAGIILVGAVLKLARLW